MRDADERKPQGEHDRNTDATLRVQASQLHVLAESVTKLATEFNLPRLLEYITEASRHLTGARYAALGVFDAEGTRLIHFITSGMDETTKQAIERLPTGLGLLGYLAKEERPVRLKDLTQHPASVGFPPNHPRMASFLGMSIRAHGRVYGRLYLTDKQGTGADGPAPEFTETDAEVLMVLATQAGAAIENVNLLEEVRTAETKHRLLLESTGEGIYSLDLEGCCTFINKASAAMLGYAPEEVIGRRMHDLIHHTRRDGSPYPADECSIYRAFRTGQGVRLDNEVLWRKDRTWFPVEFCSNPIYRDDRLIGAVATFFDVTERKEAEEALRESEERFRLIMRHANDALFYLDVTGVVLWASHRGEVVTGRPMNDLVGRPLMAVLSSQSKALAETRLAAVQQGKPVPILVELEVIRSDGSSVWLEVSDASVKTGEDVVGWLLVARDLTERRNMEQQLRQADKLAALGTLLGGIAHELNNPLFVVTGYTELVGEKVKQGQYAGLAADLAAMHEAALQATVIVERFLRIARAGGGPREPCQINDLVRQTLDLVANDCAIHQITAHTNLQADLPLVLADASVLTHVFLNLITNATQAMVSAHGKGTLTVTTALVTDQKGAWVEIRVADDGPGIAPEYHSRIFEPFFTTKPVGQGTGLGLSICHQSVTELGGTLSMESVVGQGATFIVRLPVAERSSDS